MVAQVNRSIMHPVYIVQGVSNAHCAIRSMVQRFICINDGVATDPCCGSGSTLRACLELNRNAYGFEIDRNFYERAKNEMLVEPKKVQTSMSDFLGGE